MHQAQLSSTAVMPASLYQSHYNTSCMERIQNHGVNSGSLDDLDGNRSAWKAAADIINLLGFSPSTDSFGTSGSGSGSTGNLLTEPGLSCGLGGLSQSQLEQQKQKQSQNMTECVPVPTSEHVAEIVGRQGCKIKALRAKTNTYIKTPVRGDEPVFVVTGRKEDVNLAKREILSAAEHFSQIRASRKNQTNSTVGYGNLSPNQPGQTTIQVRVPYRVVGLVVGPKGATIKRIQQQTQTYIVTPSRDKEPVFEVTGQPEMVEAARKEIEAHIELRTGSGPNDNLPFGSGAADDNLAFGSGFNSCGSGGLSNGSGSSGMISDGIFNAKFPGESSGQDSVNSISRPRPGLPDTLNGGSNFYNNINEMPSISRLKSLLDGNNSFDTKFDLNMESKQMTNSSISSLWRNSDSSWRCSSSGDSGLGNSPPFDFGDSSHPGAISSAWSSSVSTGPGCGPRDSPVDRHSPVILDSAAISKPCNPDLTPRSASIDLGIPGNMLGGGINLGINSDMHSGSSSSDSGSNQTNSLPYANPTLRSLISASFSSSLDTLSMSLGGSSLHPTTNTIDSSTDKLLEGLASNLSRQATISPDHGNSDPLGISFGQMDSKPLSLW